MQSWASPPLQHHHLEAATSLILLTQGTNAFSFSFRTRLTNRRLSGGVIGRHVDLAHVTNVNIPKDKSGPLPWCSGASGILGTLEPLQSRAILALHKPRWQNPGQRSQFQSLSTFWSSEQLREEFQMPLLVKHALRSFPGPQTFRELKASKAQTKWRNISLNQSH